MLNQFQNQSLFPYLNDNIRKNISILTLIALSKFLKFYSPKYRDCSIQVNIIGNNVEERKEDTEILNNKINELEFMLDLEQASKYRPTLTLANTHDISFRDHGRIQRLEANNEYLLKDRNSNKIKISTLESLLKTEKKRSELLSQQLETYQPINGSYKDNLK